MPESDRSEQYRRARQVRNQDAAPEGFAEFWKATVRELGQVPPQPRSIAHQPEDAHGAIAAEFESLGGAQVRCFFSGAKSHGKGVSDRPLLVTSHGYGGQMQGERVRRLASFGMDVVGLDVRGFGLSAGAVPELSPFGYLLTGSEAPETSILRGAICDYIQAARAAEEWFGRSSRVTFQGFSFAGGLSLMAAAVLLEFGVVGMRPPDVLATGAATFGNVRLRTELCQAGSGWELGNFVREHPEQAERVLRSQSFFDATHFAPFLRVGAEERLSRIVFGVGLEDPVVPAETVYSILNALPEKPEVFEMPCSHTSRPEEAEWVKWESAWIRAARKA